MNTKILFIAIAILIIAIVVVVMVIGSKNQDETNNVNNDNKSLKNIAIAENFYGFSATIKSIGKDTLTVEGFLPAASGEPIRGMVKVLVTDQTKIAKLKFPTEIGSKTDPVYPEETILKFSELKVEDKINISSAENIPESIRADKPIIINNIFIVE